MVPDVHRFPGHIARDAASRAEVVVVPLVWGGRLVGVLDLDSPTVGRFDGADAEGLREIPEVLLAGSDLPQESDHLGEPA